MEYVRFPRYVLKAKREFNIQAEVQRIQEIQNYRWEFPLIQRYCHLLFRTGHHSQSDELMQLEPGQWGRRSTKPTKKVDEQAGSCCPSGTPLLSHTRLQLQDHNQQSQLPTSSACTGDKLTTWLLIHSSAPPLLYHSLNQKVNSISVFKLPCILKCSHQVHQLLQKFISFYNAAIFSPVKMQPLHHAVEKLIGLHLVRSRSPEPRPAGYAVATTFPPWRIHHSSSLPPTLQYKC